LLFGGGMIVVFDRLPDVAKAQVELHRFVTVEKEVLGTANAAAAKAQRQELTDAAFADVLERDVLREWKAEEERLSAFQDVPPDLQHDLLSVLEYMRLREQGWQMLVEALRERSQQKARLATETQNLADAAAQRLINESKMNSTQK
jgi:hypothetical protein